MTDSHHRDASEQSGSEVGRGTRGERHLLPVREDVVGGIPGAGKVGRHLLGKHARARACISTSTHRNKFKKPPNANPTLPHSISLRHLMIYSLL